MAAGGWNFAEVWEAVADTLPDAPAQRHAGSLWTWRQFDARADAIAAHLLATGFAEQDKLAQYLYNGPEYLESVFAAFKAGLAVVNTNYRYTPDELTYLWDNADVGAVVFHGAFAQHCDTVRARLRRIRTWLWVDDGTGPCPDWATPYERIASPWPGRIAARWGRHGDHLLLLYTGGTTGMPKGVMWRQDDLFRALDRMSRSRLPPPADLADVVARLDRPGPANLPAAPLMHGTGLFNAFSTLCIGGSIVTLAGRHFDPVEVLDTVERERVKSMTIVGDAFARPILRALDAEPERWDVSSLRVIVSSGVMWSKETKDGLLRHNDRLILVDTLGSSEAIGMATSATTADAVAASATFRMAPATACPHRSGRRRRARDRAASASSRCQVRCRSATTRIRRSRRRRSASSMACATRSPATGRPSMTTARCACSAAGSQCINSGGEKVYPEEVEEVLKSHPTVADAAVVGVPDERFGEAVRALVEPAGGTAVDEATLIEHVKQRLAAYKAPKRVISVSDLGRAPNGKLDYGAIKEMALRSPDPSTP